MGGVNGGVNHDKFSATSGLDFEDRSASGGHCDRVSSRDCVRGFCNPIGASARFLRWLTDVAGELSWAAEGLTSPSHVASTPGALEELRSDPQIICPDGHSNRPGARFCDLCGSPLIEEQAPGFPVCPACGALVSDKKAQFCDVCGASLAKKVCPVCGTQLTRKASNGR